MNAVSYFSVHLALLFSHLSLDLISSSMHSSFHNFFKSSFFWPLTFLSIISSISLSMVLYLSSWLSDLNFISSISDWSVNTTCFSLSCVCAIGSSLIFCIWNFLGIMIGKLFFQFSYVFAVFSLRTICQNSAARFLSFVFQVWIIVCSNICVVSCISIG